MNEDKQLSSKEIYHRLVDLELKYDELLKGYLVRHEYIKAALAVEHIAALKQAMGVIDELYEAVK